MLERVLNIKFKIRQNFGKSFIKVNAMLSAEKNKQKYLVELEGKPIMTIM